MVPISDASFSHLRLRMWGAQAFHVSPTTLNPNGQRGRVDL
jgi:hypothetical protein